VGIADMFKQLGGIDVSVALPLSTTLEGIRSIASPEFVDGLTRATNAIHDFTLAMQGLSDIGGLSAIEVATNMGGIPEEEQLSSSEFSSGEFADFPLPTLDMPTYTDTSPIIIETSTSVTAQPTSGNTGKVEQKLDELISLMKSGGISVNLDGKKVSKTLAHSLESG
jgi:hypothetical protein